MADVLFLCTGNYYRSRFAELVFAARAAHVGSKLSADSAGLRVPTDGRNPGPISRYARAALAARELPLNEPIRFPRDVLAEELATTPLVVALDRAEHAPMLNERFPDWTEAALASGKLRFWDIEDVPHRAPEDALAAIEQLTLALHDELAPQSASAAHAAER